MWGGLLHPRLHLLGVRAKLETQDIKVRVQSAFSRESSGHVAGETGAQVTRPFF